MWSRRGRGRGHMGHYLLQVGYTPDAWKTMVQHPQDRREAIEPMIEAMGGKVESWYFAFGDDDLVAIVSMPDNTDAAAFSLAATAGGACRSLKTTPLLTTEEAVEAMRKASKVGYKAPK